MQTETVSPLKTQWDLNELRYSFVWEDSELAAQAAPENAQNALVIGSAGDIAISLLLRVQNVTAIDLSLAQIRFIELKAAAIRALSFPEFVALFYSETGMTSSFFSRVQEHLDRDARAYWHPFVGSAVPLHSMGRLDKYFRKFREKALPALLQSIGAEKATAAPTLESQREAWRLIPNEILKRISGELFSQTSLSREGRHASQFKYVSESDTGAVFLERFLKKISTSLISENPYLHYFLSGRPLLGDTSIPLWSEEKYAAIKARIDGLQIRHQDLESYLSSSENFDYFYLSDIFEYLSPEESEALFRSLFDRCREGGRIAYCELLVDREARLFESLPELSLKLAAKDRTWFYRDFTVAQKRRFEKSP